jgi:hypothetical protein
MPVALTLSRDSMSRMATALRQTGFLREDRSEATKYHRLYTQYADKYRAKYHR